ncbi:peroxisome proliferator-activated receptor gamma coactivator 1-beta isoform X2 [Scleropages formosus]|uniref:Peroxisome proliferator-activated receptor gamma, coactivator 1 beta n=1 Tax=Scleropages formosus TaxID=113540 RepID=A0A8C9T366_SCLFO|nr:peroxisome proliferator-activated receptor gamma coactivator 1-beta-like isoform X2 [Scleropages formosus]
MQESSHDFLTTDMLIPAEWYEEEEEVSSDRLDVDFPDIDLSQLDASDFDSVNCLSELHWCNDQSDSSPASIQYSTGDPELFEIEEENAALLAALTDSLDEMVEDEVGGGLCGFPSLGGGPEDEEDEEEEEEEEEDLPLDSEPFGSSLSPETEDPSLLKKLLLSPPNVPAGLDAQKQGGARLHSNRSQHPKLLRASVKGVSETERKAHAVRPAGPQCTELHRFLMTTREAEDTPSGEEDSELELEDDEEEEEEDTQESSGSEDECHAVPQPAERQFSSEKELRGMVELISYMHTYCLPGRKQGAGERRERECPGISVSISVARRARHDCPPARPPLANQKLAPEAAGGARPRLAFVRRRELKGHSLLRELLETVRSFDVSKPYRLQSPPYSHARGATNRLVPDRKGEAASTRPAKVELRDSSSKSAVGDVAPDPASEAEQSNPTWKAASGDASFSVRRSRRLASFPGRFAKRARAGVGLGRARVQSLSSRCCEEAGPAKQRCTELSPTESLLHGDSCWTEPQKSKDTESPCNQNEKRSCLRLPLAPKSTGEAQYSNKPFEQTTVSVELCGTAGLTPPTTPPHEPFKAEGRAEACPRGSWLSRTHSRKLPEQTELYAQLRRMGQAGDGGAGGPISWSLGDHDYCVQGLGDGLRRPLDVLHSSVRVEEKEGARSAEGERTGTDLPQAKLLSKISDPPMGTDSRGGRRHTATPRSQSPQALSPRSADEGVNHPALTPTTNPGDYAPLDSCCQPPSPSSQLSFSCENSETCHGEEQRIKTFDDCQVFYIHNLPSGITQAMLRRRFGALGEPKECKIVVKNEERCGVITFRHPPSGPRLRHRWEPTQHNGGSSPRRFGRKRYIDLDEAGPGPVKSKYDALDFDTLLKEAQRSLHR